MTLKDKFKEGINFPTKATLDNCEQIADDFAIEFGEWMVNIAEKYNEYLYQIQDLKELLEIYKKEKGL
jgi:hypothetical protein